MRPSVASAETGCGSCAGSAPADGTVGAGTDAAGAIAGPSSPNGWPAWTGAAWDGAAWDGAGRASGAAGQAGCGGWRPGEAGRGCAAAGGAGCVAAGRAGGAT
ncbi:hypothetical protein F8O04_10870 [Pseudoclavibacter endophyticus]|uniref:Uncharacterized protein n=1 Tax=Pseudoclavibacter endophyticus TaxID=1778590 RepID=A0A6H9WKD4_9MICO|nr:hypothetical protein F8O04_10870 [Pseudoclavibacter endophyticus]